MRKEIEIMLVDSVTCGKDIAEQAGEAATARPLQRAHDRIIRGMAGGRQQMVFDEFWREGELALMFGASGTGKSLLAVRLANALASEADIPWFRMDTEAGGVLYVDLSMSDRQFAARHSYAGRGGKDVIQPMSRRLFCDRPENESDLVEWLAEKIENEKLKYVIIDDLSSVMNTCDGTRETLSMMRGLRTLRERFGVSILVVMQSAEPREGAALSERDLGRQRALCRLADSVFGIGRQPGNRDRIYLMQTRSRNSALVWTVSNGAFGTIEESNGTVGIKFEIRISDEDAVLIKAVHRLHEEGKSYRKIALELRISKSRAARLDKRWPELVRFEEENELDEYDEEDDDDWDDDDDEEDVEYEMEFGPCKSESDVTPLLTRGLPHSEIYGPRPCPFMFDGSDDAKRWMKFLFERFPERSDREILEGYAAGDEWCRPPGAVRPRDPEDPFAGLEVDVDVLGNVKYVEDRYHDGKPRAFYEYRPDGKLYFFKADRMTPANPNLFGKFADVGKNGVREMALAAMRGN